MWFVRFLKSNVLYISWFVLYFTIAWYILGFDGESFIITSIIYASSITLALSPVGEVLLGFSEGCRLPRTSEEKNYLLPIFEEVYQNAKQVNPSLNKNITLYIMDALYVNAFAIGRKTIAVTRGAIETFTAEELKGILAHELGHMTYGHTKALLLTYIGNIFFCIIVFVLRIIRFIAEFLTDIAARTNVVGLVLRFITFFSKILFNIYVFLFVNAGQILLSANSRTNELQADKFAHMVGYGQQLIEALYVIQKISINAQMTFADRLKASHPHTAYRIEQLEGLENSN